MMSIVLSPIPFERQSHISGRSIMSVATLRKSSIVSRVTRAKNSRNLHFDNFDIQTRTQSLRSCPHLALSQSHNFSPRPQPQPLTPSRPQPRPQQSNQELTTRLRSLLNCVISILKSQKPQSHNNSLHVFYDKIVNLLSTSSSSSSNPSGDDRTSLSVGVVEELEREWWSSEIVAAWYGPTRALRERGLVGRGCENEPGDEQGEGEGEMKVKRDIMYVGLHDE